MKYPTMRYYVVRKDKYENDNSFLKQSFKYPVIVKPCCLGSSIAINKVESETELIEALDEAFKAVNKAVELIESDKQPRAILFGWAMRKFSGMWGPSSVEENREALIQSGAQYSG